MRFLHISSDSGLGDALDELRNRSSSMAGATAIPTGSLGLDLRTGFGGLPRSKIVAIGGDAEGAERLAGSTVEATAESGGAVVVVGQFDEPPAWTAEADLVVDWRGQDSALRRLLGDLGNVADLLFVDTPRVAPLIEFLTSTTWKQRLSACVVAMTGQTRGAATPVDPVVDALDQLRDRSDLVLQAERFVASPTPRVEVLVQGPARPEELVTIEYAGTAVEPVTDLLSAGREVGLVTVQPQEPILYRHVKLGSEIQHAASFLEGRPDLRKSLWSDIQSVLNSPLGSDATHGPAARYVNTWFEGDDPVLPLVVGRRVGFCMDIGPRPNVAQAESQPFTEPDFGGQDSLQLLVTLYGENFDVATANHLLRLRKTGATKQIRTDVVARQENAAIRILISLEHELTLLQDLTIRPPVVTSVRAAT
jgi:hypothetical protein